MNAPRRALFGKLNVNLFRAIESATAFAKLRGNPYVEIVHWLHQIWQVPGGDLHRLAQHYCLDAAQVDKDLTAALARLPSGASGINDFGYLVELAIERAWVFASLAVNDARIRGAWLLAAMLQSPELRRLLLDISPGFQKIPSTQLAEDFPSIIRGSAEDEAPAYDGTDLRSALPGEASAVFHTGADKASALDKYCLDLTALARTGGIDPVIGREHEIRTMVDILLRRRQNNPLLTGEAGVGKTAVVEGLALAVVQHIVPPSLRAVRILSLDVGALLAGASMKGEFESRLKALLNEATQSAVPVILFVDEIHTLIGAGGQAGTGDAANLLKPALARGSLRAIGATTWSEYKRHIEKDPALTRRFQVLQVIEPSEDAAMAMVRGLVPAFAKHHGVLVLDEAVRAAVTLSQRYIPARQLPDKAISLLDTACARVAMSMHAPSPELEALNAQLNALQREHSLLTQEIGVGRERSEAAACLQGRMEQVLRQQAALNITHTANRITLTADEEIVFNGGGSHTVWNSRGINSGTSGQWTSHAASHALVSPGNLDVAPAMLPFAEHQPQPQELVIQLLGEPELAEGAWQPGQPYQLLKGGAVIAKGMTNERSQIVVKDHQPGTTAYQVRLRSGDVYDLKLGDAQSGNVEQRLGNQGYRADAENPDRASGNGHAA